uniref:RNA methyltransferase n=1 Tax=Meloidogyne javanica TaxID=6303 RepID=A0A915M0H0_MELJA
MSSGTQQRRGGGGINMRDPLGLESVQPEQPENGENKKEVVVNTGVDDQKGGLNIKRGENKEIGEEKEKLVVDFNDSNSSSVQFEEEKKKKQQKMAERYRYGNFNNYHMKKEFRIYNNQQQSISSFDFSDDPRVSFFCPDWFFEKSILDLGCNAGRFAITLARRCQPRKVIGIDLDQHLIGAARKNIRHFADKEAKRTTKYIITPRTIEWTTPTEKSTDTVIQSKGHESEGECSSGVSEQ